ncbi:MAG: prepilin-type N-terminal cleavage/methylation domain-containing protein [Akkermansiaceae bacterium]|nr:prepilin-type N-terminal cleavage/methylation domain-containing protein [Akkermansiaceae bacterium]
MNRSHAGFENGFTLIELMVTMVLVAALCLIGFSVGKKAMVRSHQSASASNLRQWGVAMALYSIDQNGRLPRRGQGRQKLGIVNRPEDWFNALPPYLNAPTYRELAEGNMLPKPGDASIFLCPGSKLSPTVKHPLGYGMNMNLSPWNFPQATLLSNIESPSKVVFMAEAPGDYSSVYPSRAGYSLIAPHDGMGNILFLDGHVAAYHSDELGCQKGDPKRPGISWKTGTDSDANSDMY